MEFALFAFWVGGCFVNGIVAQEKRKHVLACVLTSVIFSPVFTYMYLLAAPPGPSKA